MLAATLFGLVGGLGLFLFGVNIMAEGLQKAAGNKMRRVLEVLTNIPIIGVIMGAIVTAVVQSSSAVTVMVVGFVNAGLMTLKQAVSVILGANIGTTITAQLVAFQLTDYALPAVGIGFALFFFSKHRLAKYFGQALLGFGILFLGMDTMSAAMKPLREFSPFLEIMVSFGKYPILGIIAGALFTAVIQSSSATTSLIIILAGENLIDMQGAISLVFGSNIGTTVTALLASIGTSITARRTAIAHLFFNVGGALVFLPFLGYFEGIVELTAVSLARQVANAHTIFNVANTLLLVPFIDAFVGLITRIVPGQDYAIERGLKYIDQAAILKTPPSIALSHATKEIIRMAKIAAESFQDAYKGFMDNDIHYIDLALQKEEVIDELEKEITLYLAKLSQRSMTESESRRVTALLHAVNDIERVGDHTENLSQLVRTKIEERLPFSNIALAELKTMFELVADIFHKAYTAVENSDQDLAREVLKHEDKIDLMERTYRNNHIQRLNEGVCYPFSGIVYLDIISNLERIGDHSNNIAHLVMGDWG
ncbi:MAG TPA: Na/Pi cotransporter family protein [Firmicutes bacterium]|jgi:phosphate:Na+ symporter|nr:Na/Pi cotransporter family protein [Bacillota bacterium]